MSQKEAGRDLAWAVGLAILIAVIALCVWPGYAKVRVTDIEGNWMTRSGDLYQIRPPPQPSPARSFTILGAGNSMGGELRGLRGLRTAGGDEGRVALDGSISWRAVGNHPKATWHRQGVKSATIRG